MFDIGFAEIAVLIVLALLIFGPDQLPKVAGQAGRTLRQLRRMASSAQDDLRRGMGPEFSEFEVSDLNPRRFVRKHLLEGEDDLFNDRDTSQDDEPEPDPRMLGYGERPPFDSEAT